MRKRFSSAILAAIVATTAVPMTVLAATTHHTAKPASHVTSSVVQVRHATLSSVGKSKAHGSATLTLDTKTHLLTVVVNVVGLAPKSVHPAHIHNGPKGKVVYPLSNVVANTKGVSHETMKLKGVYGWGANWWINIHQGPGLKGAQAAVIAQGKVVTK